MAIWINEESKILIQGITGKQGTFHGTRMVRYNTNVVGGVTPGKGGQEVDLDGHQVPVFDSMMEAVSETGADVSAIYVPARFAAAAIHEAAEAFNENGGGLIVCITEGIPTLDMIRARRQGQRVRESQTDWAELPRHNITWIKRRVQGRNNACFHP